jgi:hypothetical protein
MKLTALTKPADFPLEIKTHNLSGDEVTVPFIGIGRTLKDWMPIFIKRIEAEANERIDAAEKQQEMLAAAKPEADTEAAPAKPKKAKRVKLDTAEAQKGQDEALTKAVAKVREFASGWELEDEFTDENIKQLILMFPGIQGDAWEQYDQRIKGNRVKN